VRERPDPVTLTSIRNCPGLGGAMVGPFLRAGRERITLSKSCNGTLRIRLNFDTSTIQLKHEEQTSDSNTLRIPGKEEPS
jgi:hypothetical protein